jgi:hypothetical protein
MGADGRWEIKPERLTGPNGGSVILSVAYGPVAEVTTPVVPCDDAAVQRATKALYELGQGRDWPGVLDGIVVSHVGLKNVAEAVLRAAGGHDAS